jgi:hypothetical protein
MQIKLKGTKIVEIPFMLEQLDGDTSKSILIIGECKGGTEGISESLLELGYNNVTTTDILPTEPDSWLRQNTDWKHIQADFIEFDETIKYDYVISISVFEHFGFWFAGDRMFDGKFAEDVIRWNHDIVGIKKASNLLKDKNSKLIITLPAGPYMNYEKNGYPFLRGYDWNRQQLIKTIMNEKDYSLNNEKFYYSEDFINWDEVDRKFNHPDYYGYYNSITPNVIWGLTIQQQ